MNTPKKLEPLILINIFLTNMLMYLASMDSEKSLLLVVYYV